MWPGPRRLRYFKLEVVNKYARGIEVDARRRVCDHGIALAARKLSPAAGDPGKGPRSEPWSFLSRWLLSPARGAHHDPATCTDHGPPFLKD